MSTTDLVTDLRATLQAASERGILPSLFVAVVGFTSISSINEPTFSDVWLAGTCAVAGFAMTSVTYELVMPVVGLLSRPITLLGFKWVLRRKVSYGEFREQRERLVFVTNSHAALVISKEIQLRQNATYYLVAGILTSSVLANVTEFRFSSEPEIGLLKIMCMYVGAAALIGLMFRSASLGRSVALLSKVSASVAPLGRSPMTPHDQR